MKIQQYQQEAKRTLPILGEDIDRQHMVAGVVGEIGELMDAYKRHIAYGKELDRINVLEEIGDTFWYICGWATIRGYTYSNVDVPIYTGIYEIQDVEMDVYVPITPIDILFRFSVLMHFGEYQNLLNMWWDTAKCLGFSDEEIEGALDKNINKLKVRHPEKFTEENALNRNLEKEREMLT